MRKSMIWFVVMLVCIITPNAIAQWCSDPAVNLFLGRGHDALVASDRSGGVIVTISTTDTIFVKHLDIDGNNLWTQYCATNTLYGASRVFSQLDIECLIGDEINGYFILLYCYTEDTSGTLDSAYVGVVKVTASGSFPWGTDPVFVGGSQTKGSTDIIQCSITGYPDGIGGVFVIWKTWSYDSLRVAHLNSTGTTSWYEHLEDDVDIEGKNTKQPICGNNTGICYVAWTYTGGINDVVKVQKFNTSGSVWGSHVLATTDDSEDANRARCDIEGNDVIVAWRRTQSGSDPLYVQKINSSGSRQWTNTGRQIYRDTEISFAVVGNGSGSAILLLEANDLDDAHYMIGVNSSGSISWQDYAIGANGIYQMISDASHGAISVVKDSLANHIIHIGSSGVIEWDAVFTTRNIESNTLYMTHTLVRTSDGGYVVIFRTDYDWIYAQKINADGSLSSIKEEQKTPKEYEITTIPNPFNSACKISSPKNSKIIVFDIEGNVVTRLPGGKIIWEPTKEMRSGIYLIHATSEGRILKRKVCLIR